MQSWLWQEPSIDRSRSTSFRQMHSWNSLEGPQLAYVPQVQPIRLWRRYGKCWKHADKAASTLTIWESAPWRLQWHSISGETTLCSRYRLWGRNIINNHIITTYQGHSLITIIVNIPTARPRTFHVEVSAPPATRRYLARTAKWWISTMYK